MIMQSISVKIKRLIIWSEKDVLVILTVEMSLASPGTVGSWVIAFEAFSMPTDSVGLFTAYRILTINYATAVLFAYGALEQVEVAYKMDAIEKE